MKGLNLIHHSPQTPASCPPLSVRKTGIQSRAILEVSQLADVRLCIIRSSSSPSPSTQTAASDLQKFCYVAGVMLRTLHTLSYLIFARSTRKRCASQSIFLMKLRPRAFESLQLVRDLRSEHYWTSAALPTSGFAFMSKITKC